MNDETFWKIIEESHDTSMERQEEQLLDYLKRLPEEEIVEFQRLATLRKFELYTWELWGVAYLYWGGCSDDGFMDWRSWLVYCGKDAFVTARDQPDELVPVIDAHPDAGCEGIAYVPMQALREKNPKWERAYPNLEVEHPDEPRGKNWEHAELKELLPKSYERYEEEATEQEQLMKDPEYIMKEYGVTTGEPKAFTVEAEEVDIGGQKATRTRLVPAPKKLWWRFWRRD